LCSKYVAAHGFVCGQQVHLGRDQTEQWLLVRLKNPDTQTPAAPTDGSQDLFDE
jgi:hypothetical protein